MNAGQAQALLANQSALNAASQFGGQNAMTAQQMAEQSRQYGNDANLRAADLAARRTRPPASTQGLVRSSSRTRSRAQRAQHAGHAAAGDKPEAARHELRRLHQRARLRAEQPPVPSGLLRGNPVSTSQSTIAPTVHRVAAWAWGWRPGASMFGS